MVSGDQKNSLMRLLTSSGYISHGLAKEQKNQTQEEGWEVDINTGCFKNGKKMYEYTSFDGSNEGDYIYYNQEGTPILKVLYENNMAIQYSNLNNEGVFGTPIEIVNETAVIESKLQEKYNSVIIEDVREINWDSLDHIDITFMGDVLEHMTKEQAIDLVDKVMTVSRIGIISIPTKHWPQGAVGGNPFEIHVKDDWTHSEVMDTFQKYIIEGINHGKIGTYLLNSAI
jgi:hypothetical protein